MIKNTILLILLLVVSSCSKKLVGTYNHTACCMGMGCQIINLKDNNNYECISWGDIMGIDTIKGTYHKDYKMLILDPILPFEYKMQTGFVKQQISEHNDSTVVQFYSLPAIFTKINDSLYDINKFTLLERVPQLNKMDTIGEMTLFMINKTNHISDTIGYFTAKLKNSDTISVLNPFGGSEYLFRYIVKDENIDTLKIYYPTKGFNPYYYKEKFKIRKNRLFPITDKFETECLVKKNDNYKCINNQEREAIKESVYKLVRQNIKRKVFNDLCYNNFYIIFNRKGIVSKVILNPSYDIEVIDNITSFRIRQAIKKSIKKYKIPFFKKIDYNFILRLDIYYDDKTDTLKLRNF